MSANTVRLLMLARAVVGVSRAVVVDSLLDELDPDLARRSIRALRESLPSCTLIVLTARTEIANQLQRIATLPVRQGGEV